MAEEFYFYANDYERLIAFDIQDEEGNHVGKVTRGQMTPEEALATARRFTASADLLEACRAYLDRKPADEVSWLMQCAVKRADEGEVS
jgi:hypothetical protein